MQTPTKLEKGDRRLNRVVAMVNSDQIGTDMDDQVAAQSLRNSWQYE